MDVEAELRALCALYEEADGAPPGTYVAEWRTTDRHPLELHVHPAGGADRYAIGTGRVHADLAEAMRVNLVQAMLSSALRRCGRCQLCRAKAGRERLGVADFNGCAKYRCDACGCCFWEPLPERGGGA